MGTTSNLSGQYPLVSDQINVEQIKTILGELGKVIDRGVDGAVVELGCYIGTTSLFLRRLLDKYQDRREFHVYDSFAGLPLKSREDESPAGMQFKAGELSVSKKQFVQEFKKARLAVPVIHKSWFSDLTPLDMPDRIAFAFLDGDFYASIRDSLRLVLPRMQSGGTIIVDDYAREALPGVARAVHNTIPADVMQRIWVNHNLAIIPFV